MLADLDLRWSEMPYMWFSKGIAKIYIHDVCYRNSRPNVNHVDLAVASSEQNRLAVHLCDRQWRTANDRLIYITVIIIANRYDDEICLNIMCLFVA